MSAGSPANRTPERSAEKSDRRRGRQELDRLPKDCRGVTQNSGAGGMKFFRCLAATAMVVAASCGGGTDYGSVTGTNGGTQNGGSTNPVQTNAVGVSDDFFSPINAQVAVGTTVTWTWASGAS